MIEVTTSSENITLIMGMYSTHMLLRQTEGCLTVIHSDLRFITGSPESALVQRSDKHIFTNPQLDIHFLVYHQCWTKLVTLQTALSDLLCFVHQMHEIIHNTFIS